MLLVLIGRRLPARAAAALAGRARQARAQMRPRGQLERLATDVGTFRALLPRHRTRVDVDQAVARARDILPALAIDHLFVHAATLGHLAAVALDHRRGRVRRLLSRGALLRRGELSLVLAPVSPRVQDLIERCRCGGVHLTETAESERWEILGETDQVEALALVVGRVLHRVLDCFVRTVVHIR